MLSRVFALRLPFTRLMSEARVYRDLCVSPCVQSHVPYTTVWLPTHACRYPEIEPYNQGFIPVTPIHTVPAPVPRVSGVSTRRLCAGVLGGVRKSDRQARRVR